MASGFKLQNPNVKSRLRLRRELLHLRGEGRALLELQSDGDRADVCPACGYRCMSVAGTTLFDVFGLPRAFDVDVPALERALPRAVAAAPPRPVRAGRRARAAALARADHRAQRGLQDAARTRSRGPSTC